MSRSDAPAPARHVLVIDDDLALRGLFKDLLGRNGFDVDSASDGRAAYDRMVHENYEVILLDLMMPEVNGFELLERMERDSPSLLPRVIVMTGASQRMLDKLDTSKVWGLIRKPFDIHQLLSSAIACADGKRGEEAIKRISD